MIRRFVLEHLADVLDVKGEGVCFEDGSVAVRWADGGPTFVGPDVKRILADDEFRLVWVDD